MTDPQPIDLKLLEDGRLLIEWSDGEKLVYTPRQLRDNSPDALTIEKRLYDRDREQPTNELTILSPAEIAPLTIKGMQPIGRYAYQINFSDGHDTGIYTFEYLKALGEPYTGE
ncbi:MAG: DUF971 domain-containing protein [Pirellulaceae bacterium]